MSLINSAQTLVRDLLRKNPKKRLTASQILAHPWINGERKMITDLAAHAKAFEDGNATEETDEEDSISASNSTFVTLQNSSEIVKSSLSRSLQVSAMDYFAEFQQIQRACTRSLTDSNGGLEKKKSPQNVRALESPDSAKNFGEHQFFSQSY